MASITPETTIVLVTGANQGIGFTTAKSLASEHKDYHVILAGRRSDAVNEAVATLKKDGLSVSALVLDLTSEESIKAAAETVDKDFGRLDVLVNNAAISGHGIENQRERWQAVFNTNVTGTALVTDAFIPLLVKSQKTKRVVFVSSVLGSLALKADASLGFPSRKLNEGVYTHSKAALNMLALHYAADYENDKSWKFNIAVISHYCKTTLNGFQGYEDPELGSRSSIRLATLGPDGPTGSHSNDEDEVVPL